MYIILLTYANAIFRQVTKVYHDFPTTASDCSCSIELPFTVTESLFEAVSAVNVLESTAQDIIETPDMLSVTKGVATYSVAIETINIATTTNCDSGQVPVEAVCGKIYFQPYFLRFMGTILHSHSRET